MASSKWWVKFQYRDERNIGRFGEEEVFANDQFDVERRLKAKYNSSVRVLNQKRIGEPSGATGRGASSRGSSAGSEKTFSEIGKIALMLLAVSLFGVLLNSRNDDATHSPPPAARTIENAAPSVAAQSAVAPRVSEPLASPERAQAPIPSQNAAPTTSAELATNQRPTVQVAEASIGTPVIGSALDGALQVASQQSVFSPRDTVYLGIRTSLPADSITFDVLSVRWKYLEGSLYLSFLDETKKLPTSGDAYTTFRISKPDGLPVGKYRVEVVRGGVAVQQIDFSVQ